MLTIEVILSLFLNSTSLSHRWAPMSGCNVPRNSLLRFPLSKRKTINFQPRRGPSNYLCEDISMLWTPESFWWCHKLCSPLAREGKSSDDEVKAWHFWHGRQHSIKQRILDPDQKNSTGKSAFPANPCSSSLSLFQVVVSCLANSYSPFT